MTKEFSSVPEQLRNLLKHYNLENSYAEYEIKENWNKIINKTLAAVTIPEKLENQTLTIRVKDEQWKKEIKSNIKELLTMINSSLKAVKIEQIELV